MPGRGVGTPLDWSVCQGVGLGPPQAAGIPSEEPLTWWVLLTHAGLFAPLLTLAEGFSLCCWFPGRCWHTRGCRAPEICGFCCVCTGKSKHGCLSASVERALSASVNVCFQVPDAGTACPAGTLLRSAVRGQATCMPQAILCVLGMK